MNRPMRLVLVLALAAAGSWAAVRAWPFAGCLTPSNVERVRPGMSRADVYRVLGGPGWRPDCGVGIPPGEDPEFWHGWWLSARVDFGDRSGRVIRAGWSWAY